MKDITPEQQNLFDSNPADALSRVRVALEFLWRDPTRSIHDKVAGDFDYEELLGALLAAHRTQPGSAWACIDFSDSE